MRSITTSGLWSIYFAIERPWGMATRIARLLFRVVVVPALIMLCLFVAFGKPKSGPALGRPR